MATRPVFMVSMDYSKHFCVVNTVFDNVGLFSPTKALQSIESLHNSFQRLNPSKKILELSKHSNSNLGLSLNPANLKLSTKNKNVFSIENVYYSSKIFEYAGPFTDLLTCNLSDIKKDRRLVDSGELIGYKFFHLNFNVEPKGAFFNYLYMSTLHKIKENRIFADELMQYDAFTDFSFNPQISEFNPALACAIYVSLRRKGLIDKALLSTQNFINIVYKDPQDNVLKSKRQTTYLNDNYEDDKYYKTSYTNKYINDNSNKYTLNTTAHNDNNFQYQDLSDNLSALVSEHKTKRPFKDNNMDKNFMFRENDNISFKSPELELARVLSSLDDDNKLNLDVIEKIDDLESTQDNFGSVVAVDDNKKEGRVFTAYLEKKEEVQLESHAMEVPVKRKRGRPRKNPLILDNTEVQEIKEENLLAKASVEGVKRKRGRPRKNPILISNNI